MKEVFITEHALESGIKIQLAEIEETHARVFTGFNNVTYKKPDWHEDIEAAKERVEEMRKAKIEKLEKELVQLRKNNPIKISEGVSFLYTGRWEFKNYARKK